MFSHESAAQHPTAHPYEEHKEKIMRTPLTSRFDLAVPVVGAPMAGAAGGRLAAAISASGALGMVGAGGAATTAWIAEQGRIAAGRIATARGLAAVLAAGAAGAWVGTAFLACPEATVVPAARDRIVSASQT